MHGSDKKRVLAAISKLGGTVTAADIAVDTGLSPDAATHELNVIAGETGGRLQVSQTGGIAYSFQPGFAGRYLLRGCRLFVERIVHRATTIAYSLVRMSFGLGLLLSLGIIAIILSPSVIEDLVDTGISMLLSGGGGKKTTSKSSQKTRAKKDAKSGTTRDKMRRDIVLLLEKCFSFLFGDADPTVELDEKRWHEIGMLIRSNNFALVADQLAPFTGSNDDSAVLPVLIHFNGKPEVTDSGNIIYVFSALQSVSATTKAQERRSEFFEEPRWVFSKYSEKELLLVHQLAAANFLAGWGLWIYTLVDNHWHWPPMWMAVLVLYGTAFIAWPLSRFRVIEKRNAAIASRNEQRSQLALQLHKPDERLSKKLTEAEGFKLEATPVDDGSIIYSTDKDALDQPDDLSEQFDRMGQPDSRS
jgi:hypothetical protein